MNSSRAPYLIAGSIVGGIAGYLLLTDSGRRKLRAVREFDADAGIDEFRNAAEQCSEDVSEKVNGIRGKVAASVAEGRRAYTETSQGLHAQLRRLEERQGMLAAEVHRSVDELNRTISMVEKSVLDPIYQVAALVRGVECGMRSFMSEHETAEGHRPKENISAFKSY